MGAPAGFDSQVGFKSESTWGTAVVVDKFVEYLDEGIKNDGGTLYRSNGLRRGRVTRTRSARGVPSIGGPLKLEVPNITMATLLKHMFGAVATTGSGPYTHTATPASTIGQSLTVQIGKPDDTGTVQPFTYAGVKITEWELSAQADAYPELTLTTTAKSETTATALASASYAAGYAPFTAVQAALTVAGGSVPVNSFSIKGSQTLKTDRKGPGQANIREQLADGFFDYTGSVEADFEGLTQYNRFINHTNTALVVTLSNGTDSLTITCAVIFDGETPNVSGPGMLTITSPFICESATSDAAAITAVLVNSDVTAA